MYNNNNKQTRNKENNNEKQITTTNQQQQNKNKQTKTKKEEKRDQRLFYLTKYYHLLKLIITLFQQFKSEFDIVFPSEQLTRLVQLLQLSQRLTCMSGTAVKEAVKVYSFTIALR